MNAKIKAKLIENGVKNLKTFGYPDCDKDNILTDKIYSRFFKGMLEDNKGHGFDAEIESILADIESGKGK
jgi:hypothetical protein